MVTLIVPRFRVISAYLTLFALIVANAVRSAYTCLLLAQMLRLTLRSGFLHPRAQPRPEHTHARKVFLNHWSSMFFLAKLN